MGNNGAQHVHHPQMECPFFGTLLMCGCNALLQHGVLCNQASWFQLQISVYLDIRVHIHVHMRMHIHIPVLYIYRYT